MRIVIIGGSGLIGSAVGALLSARGDSVSVLSRQKPRDGVVATGDWVCGDVTDRQGIQSSLARIQPDAVVHLAAFLQSACDENPAEAVKVNVDGTLNVLEACRALSIRRVVFGSSIAVYGERDTLMRENDAPSQNTGLYGVTKWLGEMLGERYATLHGIEYIALRYCGVFGPQFVGSPGMALVRQQIKSAAAGADVRVERASGNEWIHLTHVTDAAAATLCALAHPNPGHTIYNVAGPDENYITLKAFHATVREIVPTAGQIIWGKVGRSAGRADTTRARNDLGFEPVVTVRRGLELDLDAR